MRSKGATPRADGIIDAMGTHRMARTPAQLLNRTAPVARGYEALWRTRALGLLAGRPLPIEEELAELLTAVSPVLPADVAAGARAAGERPVVLDAACSEGLYGRHLAHHGAEVVLVDHSRAFLRSALRRCRAEGVAEHVTAVRAPVQHLPRPDTSVDAVVMGGSLNEIGDRVAAMAELVRVLRPGGRLFTMSLVPATGRVGRAVQAALRCSGVTFPRRAETVALLGPSMRLVDERLDGIVLRLTAEKLPGAP